MKEAFKELFTEIRILLIVMLFDLVLTLAPDTTEGNAVVVGIRDIVSLWDRPINKA